MAVLKTLSQRAGLKALKRYKLKQQFDGKKAELTRASKAGAGAEGLRVDPSKFDRFLAALDGDAWGSALQEGVMQEAFRLRDIMIQSLVQQRGGLVRPFAPLSAATIALRRSKARKKAGGRMKGTKALIATAQMFRAITVTRRGNVVFVGVPRGARHTAGRGRGEIVNIALIHKQGAVMVWTQKQRAWFWAQIQEADNAQSRKILRGQRKDRRAAKSFSLLIIPPRPFIGPSVEVWQKDVGPRLTTFMKPRLVGG